MSASSASALGATPLAPGLAHSLRAQWWLLLLRGIIGIAFGALAFASPIVTILSLALLWGAYALADGVFALWAGVTGPGRASQRWWLTLVGLIGIGAGATSFLWPGLTAFVLVMLIGGWALVVGILQIIGALAMRKEIQGEFYMALSGAISVLFGVAVLAWPAAGVLAMVWTIATLAILIGLSYLALAFRLRRLA